MKDDNVTYTSQELEALLSGGESDLCERKESLKGESPTTVREAVCAFANDLPNHRRPGVVLVGVRDDGTATGLAITDELLRQLADKTDGNILPPPTLNVEKQVIGGGELAVVTVWPSDSPPVRFKGRIYVRVGPRRGVATAQDERILNEKRRHLDKPFDIHPIQSSTLEDLDLDRFQSGYLKAAVAPDVLDANDRTAEQRLAATKMVAAVEQPVPTVLGHLVIGKTTRTFLPGAYVQFLRIEGRELADPVVDEEVLDGTVSDVLLRLDDKLVAHNRTRVDVTTGPLEQRGSWYPIQALQQLTRNAVMHRTYEGTNAPVRVTWYEDRIEILNPGGPYGEVTAENFGTPGLTDYRNPNLAEAMRVLGFVQKFGVGLSVSRSALERNGNPPPQFRLEHGHVLAIVRPAS